jgi:hypothetical protein
MPRRETPIRLKRSGSEPSSARLEIAGRSLRLVRSPVALKMTRFRRVNRLFQTLDERVLG